ncbi:hypothetical protein [Marinobacter sp. AL4B]|nr:hypothetical protein [Marinobacter sp. AL4B]
MKSKAILYPAFSMFALTMIFIFRLALLWLVPDKRIERAMNES